MITQLQSHVALAPKPGDDQHDHGRDHHDQRHRHGRLQVPHVHLQDWIRACKGGDPACSNFSIAGPYREWMLLGAISWRFPNQKLLWDGKNLRFTNNAKANEYIKPHFRKGWELKDLT